MAANDPVLHPPLPSFDTVATESATLTQMLDFYRAVLARKGSGLNVEQLNTSVAASDLTIGGLLYHVALVEDTWFQVRFAGHDEPEPWASADWEADYDWELTNAHERSPQELFAQLDESVARSRTIAARADGLDQLATQEGADGRRWNLRWIMVHMIEEYARHCGHADFIRQAIDGVTDD